MTTRWTAREQVIDSSRNRLARRLRVLEHDRALRDREGLYIAWGIHLAREAISARADLAQAILGPALESTGEGREILRLLRAGPTPIARVATRLLESILPGSGDQGVVLLVRRPSRRDLDALLGARPRLLLATCGVQDPGNVGSILRSARAFGADGALVLEGCADPFGSRAVRAAMGASFALPIACIESAQALPALRRSGLRIIAATAGGEKLPTEIDFREPVAIVVGSEGAGLPDAILAGASARVRIPMVSGVDSLNVHASAVALLYEVARQRGFGGLTPERGPVRGAAAPQRASRRAIEGG